MSLKEGAQDGVVAHVSPSEDGADQPEPSRVTMAKCCADCERFIFV
jgi:hypothetical protein